MYFLSIIMFYMQSSNIIYYLDFEVVIDVNVINKSEERAAHRTIILWKINPLLVNKNLNVIEVVDNIKT